MRIETTDPLRESGAVGPRWTGDWVAHRLAVSVPGEPAAPGAPAVRDLVGLAVRRNPGRAHLLVSRLLGKHVPTDPRLVRAAALLLGRRVAALLDGDDGSDGHDGPLSVLLRRALEETERSGEHADRGARPWGTDPGAARELRDRAVARPARAGRCLVLGYAETATGLGHVVADALDAEYHLHSTRRRDTGVAPAGGFEESHSHAVEHLLLPRDPARLASDGPWVLVDDELSTGRTAAATIRALHRRHPRPHYVVAALVDVRDPESHDDLARVADDLGVTVDVVALAGGPVGWTAETATRGAAVVAEIDRTGAPVSPPPGDGLAPVSAVRLTLPAGVPEGARHGVSRAERRALEATLTDHVDRLVAALPPSGVERAGAGRVVVLGTEELMYLPLRLAEGLADRLDGTGAAVTFSSTTRSPVLPVDDEGYAIRSALAFPAHEAGGGDGPRFAYNLGPVAGRRRHDTAVLVVDDVARTPALHAPGGLVQGLRGVVGHLVEVVVPSSSRAATQALPAPPPVPRPPLRGPAFGSYRPDEVGWLLTDLSAVALEVPTAQREEAVRSGRAHYAESLPVEFQPGAEYQELFARGLDRAAPRLADAIARVTDGVLAEKGPGTVLVSLARAGTPLGVLMRRWGAHAHGLDLPHYAVSIVRGRGIDTAALHALARWHDPAAIQFVDGWTGKGAIVDELAAALADRGAAWDPAGWDPAGWDPAGWDHAGWDPTVAVLADPGYCTRRHGTRDDFLVPSACLNSTVSGLISRTVLRTDLVPPGGYHGGKFYAELADADVSAVFLDAITAHFPSTPPTRAGDVPPEPPDRRGLRWTRELAATLGVEDLNLVKPGVGETTRVLLRRIPELVLVHPDAGPDVDHVRVLARDRDVPVRPLPPHLAGVPSPYLCVGVIGSGR